MEMKLLFRGFAAHAYIILGPLDKHPDLLPLSARLWTIPRLETCFLRFALSPLLCRKGTEPESVLLKQYTLAESDLLGTALCLMTHILFPAVPVQREGASSRSSEIGGLTI
jgi:hypothetical protein